MNNVFPSEKFNFDNQDLMSVLSDFEWFYSPRVDKWGLRRLSDGGIQIEPTFDNIQVERELGLTVVGIEKLNKLDWA